MPRPAGQSKDRPSHQSRQVTISKALSRLLRHAAQQEGIPIDSHGYVRCDQLLRWQRLRSMQPPAQMEEVVRGVGESEKMRFGLKYVEKGKTMDGWEGEGKGNGEERKMGEHHAELDADEGNARVEEVSGMDVVSEEKLQSETQRAIHIFESGEDTEPSHFFIRANQGHSMKGVEAENLLTPITFADEASIPETVVHGTFYGAWETILRDGGLKKMGRNHIHFSTGPSLRDVLGNLEQGGEKTTSPKGRLSKMMDDSKVVSGMRRDAQILIYIDIKKALKEGAVEWWKSENGVILTEGMGAEGVIGGEYWTQVVEVKEGLGVLWEHGDLKQGLPEHLRGKALPFGKGRGGAHKPRGRG